MKFAQALTVLSLAGASMAQSAFFNGKYTQSNATTLDTAVAAGGQNGREPSVKTLLGLASPYSNVTDALKGDNTILLAPSDSAFEKALAMAGVADAVKNITTLTSVLQYHVIPNTPLDQNQTLGAGSRVYKTATGLPIKIASMNGEVTISSSPKNTAKVVEYVATTNGDILVIDSVLFPPENASTTLGQLELKSLAETATKLNLVQTLDGFQNVTIFAPNDAAFQAIQSVAAGLSPETLTQIITLHIVQGIYYAEDIVNAKNATVPTALQNYALRATLSGDNKVQVLPVPAAANAKAATVVSADNLFKGGVIHIVDTVILPQMGENGNVTIPASLDPAAATTQSATPTPTGTTAGGNSGAGVSAKVGVAGLVGGFVAAVAVLVL